MTLYPFLSQKTDSFVNTLSFIKDSSFDQEDGVLVRIPNQQVFTTNITNIVIYPVRRFDFTIGVRYSDDADSAIWLIKDLIDKEPFALYSPPPSVYVNDFGENSVNLVVRMWAPMNEWDEIKTRFLWAIKKTLEENSIEIPVPQRMVYLQNISEKKQIPEKSKPRQEEEIKGVLNYGERILI